MGSLLLFAHAFSCFSDRLWDFAFPLCLGAIWSPHEASLLAAVSVFAGQGATFALSSKVGSELDAARSLWQPVKWALFIQNGCTVVLAALFAGPGLFGRHNSTSVLCGALLLVAPLQALAALVCKVELTQSWPAVLQRQASVSDADRAHFNASLRRIYLFTNIAAPLLAGLLLAVLSGRVALAVVCGWNCLSFVAEYALLRRVWFANAAALSVPTARKQQRSNKTLSSACGDQSLLGGWKVFFRDPLFICSVAYCVLYCTVLCPGSQLHLFVSAKYGVQALWI